MSSSNTEFTTEQKRAASIACQQWGQLHVYPQKPKAIDAPAERSTLEREPDGMSVTERKLYDVNPRDHEWRKQFFNDLPEYLVKYFATRYISICEKKSFKDANIFLRERMRPASDRVRMVLANYKKLPTTQKVALLSEEHNDTEQSNFTRPNTPVAEQARFDFDQAEKNRKPVKSRILAELELDELKEMAFKLSTIIISYQATLTANIECETEEGENLAALMVYRQCAELIDQFGIKAPGAGKKLTDENVFQFISKMRCDKWWNNRLVKVRKVMREHLAIAMGQVSSKASPYASWDCIREHQEQQKRNWEAIQNMSLFDEETGEEADLAGMVLKSVSNPAIRRHELMVRCRGCEDIATSLGLQGLFLTLTTPAQYHNSYKKGGFIGHWNGASPRDAQGYLNNVWQRIRAKLSRDGIRWFGVRVAEPHHDGTPHWHLLLWVKPEDVMQVRDIFISYATQEDRGELHPELEKEKKKPFRKGAYVGPLDYRPRCDFGFIDPEKGTATGYIAKYISKNIDGFAMDDEVSDETGKSVKDMAKNVSAWKSRWCIRQFQFFGGAPVTTYRELRRFANQNKKAFMEYVFMQERGDLMAIYGMLNRHIVGPVKPARVLTNGELVEFIAANYESRIKTHSPSIAGTLKAADHGNWQGYIMGQGGPFVKRDDLLIVNVYQELPFASPHGETVRKLQGFQTPEEVVKTRLKVWTIKNKPQAEAEMVYEFEKPTADPKDWKYKGKKRLVKGKEEAEAGALALASDLALSGASGSSRSSVNNCTELDEVQVCDQLTRLLSPNEIVANSPPNMGAFSASALLKGSSVRIDNETSIQIRPAEVDEHGNKRPAQLVEVSRVPADDMNWLNFEGWDKTFAQPEQVKEEYQQPDLSFFTDAECDWPLM